LVARGDRGSGFVTPSWATRRTRDRLNAICDPFATQPDRGAPAFLSARNRWNGSTRGYVVGARGFEPPTFCSQIQEDGVPGGLNPSQPAEMTTESHRGGVQPSQRFAEKTKDFATRLLPKPAETGRAHHPSGKASSRYTGGMRVIAG